MDVFVMELAKSGQTLTLWEAWKHLTTKTALQVDLKVCHSDIVGAFLLIMAVLCMSDTATSTIGVPSSS